MVRGTATSWAFDPPQSDVGPIKPGVKQSEPRYRSESKLGAVAQLAERFVRNEEVRGSIPLSSTFELGRLRVGGEDHRRLELASLAHDRR